MTRREAIAAFWDKLPKSVRVFIYLAISIILSESLIELRNIEQGFIVRILAQIINMAIVLLEDIVPPTVERIKMMGKK